MLSCLQLFFFFPWLAASLMYTFSFLLGSQVDWDLTRIFCWIIRKKRLFYKVSISVEDSVLCLGRGGDHPLTPEGEGPHL